MRDAVPKIAIERTAELDATISGCAVGARDLETSTTSLMNAGATRPAQSKPPLARAARFDSQSRASRTTCRVSRDMIVSQVTSTAPEQR